MDIQLEKQYLQKVINEIREQSDNKVKELMLINSEKKNFSEHFSDDFYTMDDEEALGEGDLLNQLEQNENLIREQMARLKRQEDSPYFGRIDFKAKRTKNCESYYIGVHNLTSPNKKSPYVCDWRAPVSSLFYDYELGEASYDAPKGKIQGDINLKRQYQIKNGELKNCFDSSVTIGDEILRGVLASSNTKRMKTIVSTIQKEQNKIIRNNTAKNMLVQGVAGSGKTSVALHRIAYLLYQNKNTLKAEDVLILSPNTMFSEYISEVLPELGEENISQMSYYKLAQQELGGLGLTIQSREDCINGLISNPNRLNQVAYKNTYEYYESLNEFCKSYFNINFKPKDLKFGKDVIKASELEKLYNETYKTKTPAVRVEWIVDYIIDKLNINTAVQEISQRLKRIIYPFFEESNIIKIYADFLANIGMQFSMTGDNEIAYDDVGSLLFIANFFFGIKKHSGVKYLIIDEMQDYSFVDYAIFNEIFDCNKIVLGDINQCIEKILTKQDLVVLANMLNAELIVMDKCYRSTYEICDFANSIKNLTCKKFDRHGDAPKIIQLKKSTLASSANKIISEKPNQTVAILTKTKEEARDVYCAIGEVEGATLCISSGDEIGDICVMPSYLAKGLEFNVVIIPNYNKKYYSNYVDNNLLYVSCTRALNNLYLIK